MDLRAKPTRCNTSLSLSVRAVFLDFIPSERCNHCQLIGWIRFTSCYDQDSTQDDIFEQDVRPLIDVVYSGVVRLATFSFVVD